MRRLLLALAAIVLTVTTAASETITGPAVVVDGDTIALDGRQLRLNGIDAPEAAQTLPLPTGGQDFFGRGAALVLKALLQEGTIRCSLTGSRDKRGTELATCYSGKTDIGAEMIAGGMAWTTPDDPSPYLAVEAVAREKRYGLWRDQLERPWHYRRRMQYSAGSEAPNGCAFKATVDRHGNRIYFTPWSPWHRKFKIDVARGDQWLCTEADAISRGYKEPLLLMDSIVTGVYDP